MEHPDGWAVLVHQRKPVTMSDPMDNRFNEGYRAFVRDIEDREGMETSREAICPQFSDYDIAAGAAMSFMRNQPAMDDIELQRRHHTDWRRV